MADAQLKAKSRASKDKSVLEKDAAKATEERSMQREKQQATKSSNMAASSDTSTAGQKDKPSGSSTPVTGEQFKEFMREMKEMAQAMHTLTQGCVAASRSQSEPDAYYHDYDDNSYYDEESLVGFDDDGNPVHAQKATEADTAQVEDVSSNKKRRVLQKLKEEASSEEPKGPKIDDDLAENVTKFMRNKPEEAKVKAVYEKYRPPENCPGLEQVKVNELVWRKISHDARTNDLKFQRVHLSLIKGVTAFVQCWDTLLASYDAEQGTLPVEAFDNITDGAIHALRAFGAANYELNMRRREMIRPAIVTDFNIVCSTSAPFTSLLFGEDVEKTFKDIADVNRLTNQVFPSTSHSTAGEQSYRGRGRGRGRGRAQYSDRGRGRGRSFFPRGRGRSRGTFGNQAPFNPTKE